MGLCRSDSSPAQPERGQVGVGTLIVFIAMVLVAALAAGVLTNSVGLLQTQAAESSDQSVQQVSDRFNVIGVHGQVNGTQIDTVNITIKKSPGAEDINLQNVTIQWIGPDDVETVVHEGTLANPATSSQARFTVSPVKDADTSEPVMNSRDDRFELQIDLANSANPGSLQERQSALLRFTTQSGATVELEISVPDSVEGKPAVGL